MRTTKRAYTKPEVLTLGSDEIAKLVGPVQGYNGVGGGTAELSEEMLGGSNTQNINQR